MIDHNAAYPVGILRTLQIIVRAMTRPGLRGRRIQIVRFAMRTHWRVLRLRQEIQHRKYRAGKILFNGYRCEHIGHPHGAGTGWTKQRASSRAKRLCRGGYLTRYWLAAWVWFLGIVWCVFVWGVVIVIAWNIF